MKLQLDITPDLVAMMAAEIKAGEKAVSQAVNQAGNSVKTSWRAQITGALDQTNDAAFRLGLPFGNCSERIVLASL